MKKVSNVLLILLLSTTAIFAQVNLKNGLVACYPFNANAKDESGNGNNGTVNGATLTTDRFGKANSAYNFNGSSLIAVNPAQFKNQSYTYATWVKLDNLPSAGDNNCFITVGGAGGDQVLSVTSSYQAQTSNGFNVGGYNNGNPIQSNNWNNVTPTIGKWYHVACTRDNNSVKLYVDGQLIANNSILTTTGGTTPNYGSPTYVTFGARNGGASQYMQGSLDDIHLYNRPLSAAEVKALYDENPAPTIRITTSSPTLCGGDKITFAANGASATAKYQWKVDGVDAGTDNQLLTFNTPNISAQYQVKITVEVTDNDPCFPQKSATTEQIFTLKNCVTTPSTGVDLKNGLVACYPFNANAKDESGNGHDGTVSGVILTTDRFGKGNSAYTFNRPSYIELANQDGFFNKEFSYSAWVELSDTPSINDAHSIFSITGGTQMLYVGNSSVSNNQPAWAVIYYSNENSTLTPHPSYTDNVTVGRWHHFVSTQSSTEVKLYLNGVIVRTSTFSSAVTPTYLPTPKSAIGARDINGTFGQGFKGKIDDIHIYNRPLSAAEVKALYDGNNPQNITITTNKANPCGGDKITFTANGATNTSKYQWKVDGVNQGSNSKTFVYNSANKTADYQVKITVEVTDEDPCFPQKPSSVDKTVNVKFCTTPAANANNNTLIPNAFSPNGDGTNDTWEIFNPTSGNADLIVEIYNRWGELIFYSKGYSVPWDGTYKDKPVPEGTYAYVVRVDSNTVLRGVILVVR
jgi:gliding motility-associated-like protein